MYKLGESVIVTEKLDKKEVKNSVGVIMDIKLIKKNIFYDVLMETRSVFSILNTAASNRMFINRTLSKTLCEPGHVIAHIPYKYLVDNEMLPIVCA